MNAVMPMGFFENTQEIYAEVASYPVVPPEKIKEYWNAYTTTFRRLFDPSAFRLENFWWHVWGSDKLRNLSGPALARLFEEFSTGPTFVPLSPPLTRNAGRKPAGARQIQGPGHQAATDQARRDSPSHGASVGESKKAPTPSSSRPPPAHPILKKSRGPSTSGRRPTARFVSPLASGDEAVDDDEASSASTVAAETGPASGAPSLPSSAAQEEVSGEAAAPSTTTTTHSDTEAPSANSSAPMPAVSEEGMAPPPPPAPSRGERSVGNSGRRIVVSSATSRRRPVMVRRPSSQSSAGSDGGSRVTGFMATSRRSSTRRPTPTPSQLLGEGSLSSQTSDPPISAKAAGKRPAKPAPSRPPNPRSLPPPDEIEAAALQQTPPISPQRRSTWDVRDSLASQATVIQRRPPVPAAPPVEGFVTDQPMGFSGPSTVPSSRPNRPEPPRRLREPGVALLPSQATSVVATSVATARGLFDSETAPPLSPADPVVSSETQDIPGPVSSFRSASYSSQQVGLSSSSVLERKFKPTPPNLAPPIPFGRSRSELTLLLERGKPNRKGEDA